MRVNTQYNQQPYTGRIMTQVSRTLPDQSISIKELITRSRNGLPVMGNSKEPIYGEDLTQFDFDNMSIVEKQDFIQTRQEILTQFYRKMNEEKERNNVENLRKQHYDEFEKSMLEKQNQQQPQQQQQQD